MARTSKKKQTQPDKPSGEKAYIENAGLVIEEKIVDTLEKNFMPYAMSVIISRALPEIDGFKPSHRKLLYTMYQMNLLGQTRTKSANVVGQTMRLNPHGEGAIYETMVRMARGNEALLHPYVDSKGNFGKAYSRDMAYAASRYTEVKLDAFAAELFKDIDKDTVDFVPNYDNTTKEPVLLPTTFPAVLVNSNFGLAVSMASSVCPFNLKEVCDTTIALIKNPDHNALETLKGPDFPGGGYILYDEKELDKIYRTGRGSVTVRARYQYDKENNCIEITEIPYSTTIEAIMDKIAELVKGGRVREISYMRDETDLNGLKIALDLKRGTDPDKLMQKLYKITPLQDNYSCNFNILIAGMPRVMGVYEIVQEWTAFRSECVRRRVYFDLQKKKERLHLLQGLQRILLDIDKAVKIVRETQEERDVVPNLMIGFGIDEVQAEYVAEIKLRHLNREYILKRTGEIEQLQKDIDEMEGILDDPGKIKAIIVSELKEVGEKFGKPRKSLFYYADEDESGEEEDEIADYPVHLFVTQEGYFKKITPQSLRMSSEQKLKEGDILRVQYDVSNKWEILCFTDQQQVYKARVSDFDECKASTMGDYLPAKLGFDEGEQLLQTLVFQKYEGNVVYFFENGKAARVPLKSFETKTKRRKLSGAYTVKSRPVGIYLEGEAGDYVMRSTDGRMLIVYSGDISVKQARDTIGVNVMSLKKNQTLSQAYPLTQEAREKILDIRRYRPKTLPSPGALLRETDDFTQLSL